MLSDRRSERRAQQARSMHEPQRKAMRRRLLRGTLAGVGLLLVALCVQLLLRSSVVLRSPVEARIATATAGLDLAVSISSIRPVGVWGVRLGDVVIRGTHSDEVLGRVEAVDVYVEPTQLLWRNVEVRQVVIIEPVVVLELSDTVSGPLRWVRDILQTERSGLSSATGSPSRRSYPPVLVRGGQLDVHDAGGVFPGLHAELDELYARPAAGASGRVEIQGLLWVAGFGRMMLQGSAFGGEPPRVSVRALQDNDLFAMLPASWRPSRRASLNVGAMSLQWPPAIELGPATMRDLDIALPGFDGWRVRNVYAEQLSFQFSRAGIGLRMSSANLVLGGLLADSDLRVASVEVFRAWDGGVSVDLELADGEGGTLRAEALLVSGAESTVRVVASTFRFASLARLLPMSLPARPIRGAIDADVRIAQVATGQAWTASGQIAVQDGAVRAPFIASQMLEDIDATAHFDLWARPAAGQWRFERVELESRGVRALATASLLLSEARTTVELAARVPVVEAQRLLEALPRGFAPAVAGFELSGSAALSASLYVDTAAIERSRIGFAIEDHGVDVRVFGALAPVDRLAGEEFAWTVATFDGTRRDVGPGTAHWVSLPQVAESLHRSVLASEDDGFYQHGGFDWRGMHAALLMNLHAGGVVRGGSTVTQQVAKNLFLNHDRTVARKVQEAFFTWLLERYVPKQRILEAYINLAHWGPGVYGIGEAAMRYFQHVPQNLTVRESVFLAAILPNPALFGEQYAQGLIPPSRQQKIRNIMNNLQRSGFLSAEEAEGHLALLQRGLVSASLRPDFSTAAAPDGIVPAGLDEGPLVTP